MGWLDDSFNFTKNVFGGGYLRDAFGLGGTSQQENYANQMQQQYAQAMANRPDLTKYFQGLQPPNQSALFNQYAPQNTNFSSQYAGLQAPDLLGQFNANAPSVSQYFDPSKVNAYYNQATQNLNQNVGANVNQAQSMAGQQAAARGYANSGNYVNSVGTGVRQSFAPQYGQIEQGRAGAMQQLDANTYSALANQALQRANLGQQQFGNQMSLTGARVGAGQEDYSNILRLLQGRMGAGQQDYSNQFGLANAQMGAAQGNYSNQFGGLNAQANLGQFYDPSSGWDKFLALLGGVLPAAGQAYGSYLGTKKP